MDLIASLPAVWLGTLKWLLMLGVPLAVLCRLMPCNPGMYWWKDLRAVATDLLYFFIVPVFLRLVRIELIILGMIFFYGGNEPDLLPVRGWPIWLQCVVVQVLQDVLLYGIHRVFHTKLAWRFHAIHHSPHELDWTAMARFHPLNNLLAYSAVDIFVLLLGFSAETILILTPINIVYSAMVHANLNWTFGPFKYLLASPVFHRWHHTTEAEGLDKNFAATFPLLDVVFGTFHMPPGKLPANYGCGDPEFPEDFLGQFIYPFLPKRRPTAEPAPPCSVRKAA